MDNIFTSGNSQQEIFERMIQNVPATVSTRPGTFMGDYLTANAIEDSNIYVALDEVVNSCFLDTATGEYLDMLGAMYNLTRNEGTPASGVITVTFQNDGTLDSGYLFTTDDLLQFQTTMNINYKDGQTVNILVQSVDTGYIYNINDDVPLFSVMTNANIVSIERLGSITGGSDIESDDIFRARIYEYIRSFSGAGTKSDYEIWAKSQPGVDYATCIPLWNGNGTVKVIISGQYGAPVSTDIINEVQNYISPNPGTGEGVAPIGASVTVVSSTTETVDIEINTLSIDPLADMGEMQSTITTQLSAFILTNFGAGEPIVRQRLQSFVMGIAGVVDFHYISIAGAMTNYNPNTGVKVLAGNITFT